MGKYFRSIYQRFERYFQVVSALREISGLGAILAEDGSGEYYLPKGKTISNLVAESNEGKKLGGDKK